MAVKQKPLRSAGSSGAESAFIPGSAIDASRPYAVRASSVMLLVLSFLLSIVALHRGDWGVLASVARMLTIPTLVGVVLQTYCTMMEWWNRDNKLSFWYGHAFVLDVVPSWVALFPISVGMVRLVLGLVGVSSAEKPLVEFGAVTITAVTLVALPISFVFAVGIAYLPETRLIKE